MTYKASLDKMAIAITIFVTVLFAVIILGQNYLLKFRGSTFSTIAIVVCIISYAVSYSFRPVNYTINFRELIIHRPVLDVKINRTEIKSAEVLNANKTRGFIRTFGVGGLFGYFGKYRNSDLGNMTWYATQRKNYILIEKVDGKRIILTPDDPQRMITELNS